jgi:hypothetical protein
VIEVDDGQAGTPAELDREGRLPGPAGPDDHHPFHLVILVAGGSGARCWTGTEASSRI